MAWQQYLDDDMIKFIIKLLIDDGVIGSMADLNFLLESLPNQYRMGLGGESLDDVEGRAITKLREINGAYMLRGGEVPLALILSAAIERCRDAGRSMQLEEILENVEQQRLAPQQLAVPPSSPIAGPTLAVAATPIPAPAQKRHVDGASHELESTIGNLDETVSIEFLVEGARAAQSVFKLIVPRFIDGEQEFVTDTLPRQATGTGWIIAPGIGITNHHVFDVRQTAHGEPHATANDFNLQIQNSVIVPDYTSEDGNDPEEVAMGSDALLAANADLDFAIFKLTGTLATRTPLRLRVRPLRKASHTPLRARVNVLQHPNGKPMRLGFRSNFVVVGNGDELAYLTDTAKGSSGSPVLDDSWSVAALHYGSQPISDVEIDLLGTRIRRENVGRPMPKIMTFLEEHHATLHQEIQDAQAQLTA